MYETSIDQRKRVLLFVLIVAIAQGRAKGADGETALLIKESTTLVGHTKMVTGIAFSPNGQLIASGSYDETIRLWNIGKGKQVGLLRGHSGAVCCLHYSADGKMLLSTSLRESIVRLWNISVHKSIGVLQGHAGSVLSVVTSPDSSRVATGGSDKTVRLWDIQSHKELAVLRGHQAGVLVIVYSSDGKTLASVDRDGKAILWDIVNSRQKRAFGPVLKARPWSIALSEDMKTLAAENNGPIALYELSGRQHELVPSVRDSIIALSFSKDNQMLASTGYEGRVRLWEVATRRHRATLTASATRIHRDYGNAIPLFSPIWGDPMFCVTFSRNGNLVATGNSGCTVKVWDITQLNKRNSDK